MKLIFFDIDGTLIDEKGRMAPSTVKAIEQAQRNGNLCLVNTGRTACLVRNWLPKLAPFDGYLCGCGTHLIFRGKELLHQTFTPEQGQAIIDGLNRYRIDAILEGAENDFHNDPDKMYTETFRQYILEHSPGRNWGSYREAPGNFDKFYCFSDIPGNVRRFVEEMGDLLDLIDRENGYYEVVPRGFSKASAMDDLLKYLNDADMYEEKLTPEDTAAIGDSGNDLPMLEHAGCAIAMGNSSRCVLDVADYTTAAVQDDGIAKALEWLGVLSGS